MRLLNRLTQPITMAGGHDVDEDSYSVSSFDADDLAPSVTAKAQ